MQTYTFHFDRRWSWLLRLLGITPLSSRVEVDDQRVLATFGPWTTTFPIDDIESVRTSGPYRSYRAIGPRGSLADGGITFGSTADRGVCIVLRRPTHGLDPFGVLRHRNVTLTVEEPERLVKDLAERMSHRHARKGS